VVTRSAVPRALAASLAAGLSLGLLAGCAFGPPTDSDGGGPPNLPAPTRTSSADDDSPPSVVATVIATGLRIPWALAFLPDGTALATQRDTRQIVKVGPAAGPDGLQKTPVQTIDEATASGEGGLLGIAVSPDYVTDQTVFIYYTTTSDNRIAKLKLGEKPVPIVTGIPRSGIHNGGRLQFGPDGFLYASTGDASSGGNAQDLKSLGGKILRMTKDGMPPPDNPFPNSLVWSYGHRNVQGLAWDTRKRLFATEFGQNTWDEVNLIEPGKNYGWPTVEGIGKKEGFVDPIQQWPTSEASCSGAAMTGNIFVAACLRGQRLWLLRISAAGKVVGSPTAALVQKYGRLRAAVLAPDGSIWVSTSNYDGKIPPREGDDKIIRIVVSGSAGVSKA
jgi:glucose/arabinose dehydrogenase